MADDRDRKKLTFSERDKLRGKSRDDRDRGGSGRNNTAQAAAQKSYRAALERAFEAGTLSELAKTLNRVEEPRPPKPPEAKPAEAPAADAPAPVAAAPLPAPAGDPERENRMKLLARIREAEGREPISKAIDAFLARYPKLPDDFEILTKALSHRDDELVLKAILAVEALCAKEKPRRGRALVGQLRFLEETHADPELRQRAGAARAKL
jgi:hypothetical protein